MALIKNKNNINRKPKETKMAKTKFGSRTLIYTLVMVFFMVGAFAVLLNTLNQYKETVNVVTLKEAVGNNIITATNIKSKSISARDYEKGMILWDEREDKIVNKYPTIQIRHNVPIYDDMVTNEQIVKYSYLYELAPDEELITFKYDNSMAAGRIPVPGDRFRIRGSYQMTPEEKSAYQASVNAGELKTGANGENVKDESGNVVIKSAGTQDYVIGDIRTALIFDVVTVVDMLNSNGDSIYEIMRGVQALPKDERDAQMETDVYKGLVTPTSMLIIIKSDQASKYTEFQAASNAAYTISLLTRDESLKNEDIKSGVDSIVNGNSSDKK